MRLYSEVRQCDGGTCCDDWCETETCTKSAAVQRSLPTFCGITMGWGTGGGKIQRVPACRALSSRQKNTGLWAGCQSESLVQLRSTQSLSAAEMMKIARFIRNHPSAFPNPLAVIRVVVVVVVVTFFNHNFVNCKATLILAIKIYEIKYNTSLNDIHT